MNFKMKALVAAAVVATTMSGAANAITVGANGELFLAAYDSVAKNSYIKALGTTALAFDGSSSQDFSALLSTDANWASFAGAVTNSSSVTYQVLGFSVGAAAAPQTTDYASVMRTTATSITPITGSSWALLDASVSTTGGALNMWMANGPQGNLSVTGTGSSFIAGSSTGASASMLQSNWDTLWNTSINTTATLGANDGFYTVTRDPSTARGNGSLPVVVSALLGNWNLSATGNLTYTSLNTAPVPEADSAAMLFAGLGLMGFVARRRNKKA